VAEAGFKVFVDDAHMQWQKSAAFGAVEIITADHAAGLVAMARAVEALQKLERDVCVVAGVDSLLEPTFLHDLWAERRLKTPDGSNGLVPGEAAAVVVLERSDDAARGQLPVLARIGSLVLDREPSGLRPAEALHRPPDHR
jgi:3-oxoacyl-[acyl-carrier-protein] synthase-1